MKVDWPVGLAAEDAFSATSPIASKRSLFGSIRPSWLARVERDAAAAAGDSFGTDSPTTRRRWLSNLRQGSSPAAGGQQGCGW
jgi:hypothetical protein